MLKKFELIFQFSPKVHGGFGHLKPCVSEVLIHVIHNFSVFIAAGADSKS